MLALIFHRSKTGAQAVGPQQAVMLINRNDGVVLDIREKKDYDTGHIVDSVHIPHTKLNAEFAGSDKELSKLKSRPIIVVCKMGQHSGDVCKMLRNAGFEQVVRLRGGMAEWRAQNLPLVQKDDKVKAEKAKSSDKKSTGKKKSTKPPRPRKSGKPVDADSSGAAPIAHTGGTNEVESAGSQAGMPAGQDDVEPGREQSEK
ncbi:MAG: rhodanese-like domain-containing protein [Pseudohongiella sp.]